MPVMRALAIQRHLDEAATGLAGDGRLFEFRLHVGHAALAWPEPVSSCHRDSSSLSLICWGIDLLRLLDVDDFGTGKALQHGLHVRVLAGHDEQAVAVFLFLARAAAFRRPPSPPSPSSACPSRLRACGRFRREDPDARLRLKGQFELTGADPDGAHQTLEIGFQLDVALFGGERQRYRRKLEKARGSVCAGAVALSAASRRVLICASACGLAAPQQFARRHRHHAVRLCGACFTSLASSSPPGRSAAWPGGSAPFRPPSADRR